MIIIADFDPSNPPAPTDENRARGKAWVNAHRENALDCDMATAERLQAIVQPEQRQAKRKSRTIQAAQIFTRSQASIDPPKVQNFQRWALSASALRGA